MRIRGRSRSYRPAALIAASLLGALTGPQATDAQSRPGRQSDASVVLPNGQRITPAGTQIVVSSMPLAAELSPDGRYLLVLQAGYETPSVSVIDTASGKPVHRVELPDAWLGLTFNRSGDRVFVGGGGRSSVWDLSFRDGSLTVEREFPIRPQCAKNCSTLIGDVRLDADDRMLYALDVFRDRAVVINTQSGLVLEEFKTGAAPYRARLTPDLGHLVISHWGEASLGLYRISDRQLVERIPVGEHPTDLLVVHGEVQAPGNGIDGDEERAYAARLFTACAHADNLWTHGITEQGRYELLDVRSVAPLPASPVGSLPSALGVSEDRRTLFVANAGNNTILVVDLEEVLPEPAGAVPTAWFPTAVVGLGNGGMAYLSGKGDGLNQGLVSILPPLNSDQLEFLSSAAVANLSGPTSATETPPSAVRHVALVLTDARGAAWERLLDEAASLPGYVSPARGQLSQVAWLTGGMETDFFAKLSPSVVAGRLTARDLAAAGRAALPAAGTLWSNAVNASLAVETYGIARGRPLSAWLAKLRASSQLARLTVVRLTGAAADQDEELGTAMAALREHPSYSSTVLFVVPTDGARSAALAGGPVLSKSVHEGFVTSSSVLRTIEWLLGLRPMTQFDAAARVLAIPFASEN